MLRIILLSVICVFVFVFGIQSQTLNLLPDIPEPATNPHLPTAFNGVKSDKSFSSAIGEAEETITAAYAYLHPSSPYKNQQAVLDRLLFLLETELGGWDNGTYPLNDWAFCSQSTLAFLMLKQYKPSVIPVSSQASWESGIRKNIDAIFAAKADLYTNHIVGSIWLNGDVKLAMGAYYGSLALNDAASAAKAKYVIENVMTLTLLPDGATHYVGYQNESPSYHGEASMRPFLWYYIVTRSQIVKDFLCGTKNYIPLMQIPMGEGFKEWSTSPAWKPYYNRTTLKPEALGKAYLSGDPYNYTIGQGSQNLYLVFLYRSGLSAATLPDNYILYDKNCMGPRGRYANWGVIATLRDPSVPSPELTETRYLNMDGVSTIVGAFTLNASASASTYPLNAALQGTAPEVKYASGEETDWQRGAKWAFLTGKDRKDAITRTKNIFGLSTRYGVSKTRFVEVGWSAQQQWVVTPDRVIGMCEIENSVASSMYGLAQRIQLVSGRRNASGTRKILNKIDDNTFEYGDLRMKILAKNYAGLVDTLYHGVMNDTLDNLSVMINLHDLKSGNDVAYNYPANTRRYAFFEVTNKDRTYSTNATRVTLVTGLEGFEFQESSGRKIRMIHNVTGSSVALNSSTMSCPYQQVRLIKSWDESTLTALTITNNSTTVPYTSIPAYGHVLVINSIINDDHMGGYNTYSDIFPTSLTDINTIATDNNLKAKITVDKGIISIDKSGITEKVKLSICDIQGDIVKSLNSERSESQIKLDVKSQPKGVYFIKFKTENGCSNSYKLLLK
ncbi:MAG: T9SS type A sorting domain-containing protein [Paludibacter sp.]